MVARAAEQLATHFNPARIALAVTSALHGPELIALRDTLLRAHERTAGALRETSTEIRQLIRQMSMANPIWGAPRIHGELLMLGIAARPNRKNLLETVALQPVRGLKASRTRPRARYHTAKTHPRHWSESLNDLFPRSFQPFQSARLVITMPSPEPRVGHEAPRNRGRLG